MSWWGQTFDDGITGVNYRVVAQCETAQWQVHLLAYTEGEFERAIRLIEVAYEHYIKSAKGRSVAGSCDAGSFEADGSRAG